MRKPSSWKKVPLKCLHPPSCSLLDTTNKRRGSVFLTEIVSIAKKPSAFAWCIVIHWVCAVQSLLWARNGRLSSCTNTENMAPSLCVSAQPLHCFAIRGSRATALPTSLQLSIKHPSHARKNVKIRGLERRKIEFLFSASKNACFELGGVENTIWKSWSAQRLSMALWICLVSYASTVSHYSKAQLLRGFLFARISVISISPTV